MRTLSNREAAARLQFLDDQWNRPSLTDHYLMQTAMEAFYSNRKRPDKPDMDPWKLKFTFENPKETGPKTVQQASAWAKAKWFSIVGVTRDVIRRALGK